MTKIFFLAKFANLFHTNKSSNRTDAKLLFRKINDKYFQDTVELKVFGRIVHSVYLRVAYDSFSNYFLNASNKLVF